MDTAVVALMISAASLVVSLVNARANLDALKRKRKEDRFASEAEWNFRIINDDQRLARYTKGSPRRRSAVITYTGERDVVIVLLTPLTRFDEGLLPAIAFTMDDENPTGRIPGWRTSSGSLLSVDIVIQERNEQSRCREFWFYVNAATRPAETKDYDFALEILVSFEELVASRRVRQIRLKSDRTAWASDDAASAT